jgi:hypothetical protein
LFVFKLRIATYETRLTEFGTGFGASMPTFQNLDTFLFTLDVSDGGFSLGRLTGKLLLMSARELGSHGNWTGRTLAVTLVLVLLLS